MGELKTRFMRGDRYGIQVVAWRVSDLIHDLHRGTDAFDGISTEALDNPVWDDLVVEQGMRKTRWQVKRQTTTFEAAELEPIVSAAQAIRAAPEESQSAFQIAMRELVPVHFPQPAGRGRKAKFLQLSHLQQLCTDAAVPGMQATKLINDDTAVYREWWPVLAGWIGTNDPANLYDFAKALAVTQLGDEAHLTAQSLRALSPFYEQPEQVLEALVQFFANYADGRIKVTPKILAEDVLASFAPRTGSALWFDLSHNATGTRWELRSPRVLKKLAEYSWIATSTVDLTLASPPVANEGVTAQLTRLLLHGNNTTTVRAHATTQWAAHADRSCFGTLGVSETPISNVAAPNHNVGHFPPIETFLPDVLANRLGAEMDALVWSAVQQAFVARSGSIGMEPDLKRLVLERWEVWHEVLSSNPRLRAEFTTRATATEEELNHPHYDRLARHGHQLVRSIAEACVLAVAVAVAFFPGGVTVAPDLSGKSGNLKLGDVPAHLLAVSFALDRGSQRACSLAHHPYWALQSEPSILLLSGVPQEEESLRRFWEEDSSRFSDVERSSSEFSKCGPLLPMITLSGRFIRSLQRGLPELRSHLGAVFAPLVSAEYAVLKTAIGGATT